MIQIIKILLRPFKKIILSLYFKGNNRYCPVCEKTSRKFVDFGTPPRSNARCIHCNLLERDRFAWLFFKKYTNLFSNHPKKMLHIAPEKIFQKLLSTYLGEGYLTADLYNPSAMVKMDITDIQYPNETFDVIYCSHVLEHVPDDKKQ